MAFSTKDIIPLKQVRARLTELAEDVRAGREKIITRNGEAFVALVDAKRLDYYHQLERERIHIGLLTEAAQGLRDIAEGRSSSAAALRKRYRPKKAA